VSFGLLQKDIVLTARKQRTAALYAFDAAVMAEGKQGIVGVDEAGRGPLAGPVIAAAVMLDHGAPICGVNDSKKLSARAREELYAAITKQARAYGVGAASPEEIDKYNILRASLLAMKRALDVLNAPWSLALVDGNQPIPTVQGERQRCVVGGDALSASIAAASIVAKVTRDRIMAEYDRSYPDYRFAEHKGYPTAAHRQLLLLHGPCAIHRKSFCEKIIAQIPLPLEEQAQGGGSW
jgi:ribonuclease HII